MVIINGVMINFSFIAFCNLSMFLNHLIIMYE